MTNGLEPTPAVIREFNAVLPEEDEPLRDVPTNRDLVGTLWDMDYVDAAGEKSERRVTVRSVHWEGGTAYLTCYCHTRRAPRTFRADRIALLSSPVTGEVLAADDFAPRIFKQENPTILTLRSASPGVQILTFIAHIDGEYAEEEHDVILDYIDYCRPDPETDFEAASIFVKSLCPDRVCFESALEMLPRLNDAEADRIRRFYKRVIYADGVVAEAEAAAMAELGISWEDLL